MTTTEKEFSAELLALWNRDLTHDCPERVI